MVRPVIFTDLDATLLDRETYSFHAARPVLKKLKRLDVPVILTTSKTRAETEVIAGKLKLNHPFIVENGGAVFIPSGYFPAEFYRAIGARPVKKDGYQVIRLGVPYQRLRKALKEIERKTGVKLVGFGDMSEKQIAALTGLKRNEVRLAARREFDEPFLIEDETETGRPTGAGLKGEDRHVFGKASYSEHVKYHERIMAELKKEAKKRNLRITAGGRFFHLTGNNDKGRAVRLLKKLFRLKFGAIITAGLGDSDNDWPMLKEVDYPVLVSVQDGSQPEFISEVENVYRTAKPGPEGWAEALECFLAQIGLA